MTSKKRKGPRRDQFFEFAKQFSPLTQTQSEAYAEYKDGKNLMLRGFPGTGKTYIACAFALEELMAGTKENIRVVRCAVSTRDIGFQPGDEAEKMAVYEKPYIPMFSQLVGRGDAYATLKLQGKVSFESTSFLRGMTYDNSVIIVDECQSMTFHEINTIATRLGKNSRIIFCGDDGQRDVPAHQSGFSQLKNIVESMDDWFSWHEFDESDILRSGFVKDWIIAVNKRKE